jgi:hypothetical protein
MLVDVLNADGSFDGKRYVGVFNVSWIKIY